MTVGMANIGGQVAGSVGKLQAIGGVSSGGVALPPGVLVEGEGSPISLAPGYILERPSIELFIPAANESVVTIPIASEHKSARGAFTVGGISFGAIGRGLPFGGEGGLFNAFAGYKWYAKYGSEAAVEGEATALGAEGLIFSRTPPLIDHGDPGYWLLGGQLYFGPTPLVRTRFAGNLDSNITLSPTAPPEAGVPFYSDPLGLIDAPGIQPPDYNRSNRIVNVEVRFSYEELLGAEIAGTVVGVGLKEYWYIGELESGGSSGGGPLTAGTLTVGAQAQGYAHS